MGAWSVAGVAVLLYALAVTVWLERMVNRVMVEHDVVHQVARGGAM